MATTSEAATGEADGRTGEGATVAGPEQRPTQHLSLRWPAFVVLGLALLIAVGGAVASALATGGDPTLTLRTVTIPDGTVVHLTPAAAALRSVITAGQPPADILASLAVPAGSTVTGSVDADRGATQYSRTVRFTSGLSTDQLVSFYRTLLPRLGWTISYVGPGIGGSGSTGGPGSTGVAGSAGTAAGGTEVLAKRGSSDGYYWEVGAVVLPTASTGTTSYSVALFEVPDAA